MRILLATYLLKLCTSLKCNHKGRISSSKVTQKLLRGKKKKLSRIQILVTIKLFPERVYLCKLLPAPLPPEY